MRIPNPRLIRLGAIVGGAITEPGDGQAVVPAVLQPCIELAGPLGHNGATTGLEMQDTWTQNLSVNLAGVQIAANTVSASIYRGLWLIDITWHAMFTGTTSGFGTNDRLTIQDDQGVDLVLAWLPRVNTAQQAWANHFVFEFEKADPLASGWRVFLHNGATVGGDQLCMAAGIHARRVV